MPFLLPLLLASLTTILPALSHPLARADSTIISCTPYIPTGWSAPVGKIYFYDNNPTDQPGSGAGLHAQTLPANATIGIYSISGYSSAFMLADHTSTTGHPFTFSACNISTPALALITNTTQSSCTHGACYVTYTNYVRVLPARSSDSTESGTDSDTDAFCLTATNYNTSSSDFEFLECVDNPVDKSQIFTVTQTVNYAPGYAKVTSHGPVELGNSQNYVAGEGNEGQLMDGVALAWSLEGGDNMTVSVVQDQYTQVGLSAILVEA